MRTRAWTPITSVAGSNSAPPDTSPLRRPFRAWRLADHRPLRRRCYVNILGIRVSVRFVHGCGAVVVVDVNVHHALPHLEHHLVVRPLEHVYWTKHVLKPFESSFGGS